MTTVVAGNAALSPPDHRALVYADDDALVGTVAGFVRDGLAAGEGACVVASDRHVRMLADVLGADADGVAFAPSELWWQGSGAKTLLRYDDAMESALAAGFPRLRVVGEPVWQASPRGRAWWTYESMANRHFAGWPVSLLCAADVRTTPTDVVDRFRCAHPALAAGEPNPAFVEPAALLRRDPGPVPADAAVVAIAACRDELAALRAAVRASSLASGVAPDRRDDVVMACNELAVNALWHGRAPARVRTWTENGYFVCDVSDHGAGVHDSLAGLRRPSHGTSPRGLWLVRALSDDLQFRAEGAAPSVRAYFAV